MSKVTPLICRIWSTYLYSPIEVSRELRGLNVSHSIDLGAARKPKVIDMKRAQPMWVKVIRDESRIDPSAVNIICAPFSHLLLTNIPPLEQIELGSSLRKGLVSNIVTSVVVKKVGPIGYVNRVAKPSLLNKVQTEVYKIQPYSLRKEIQSKIMAFFNSKISERSLIRALSVSYKTEGLIPLIEQGSVLRNAVMLVKNGEDVNKVSAKTGVPTFELLYLNRSNLTKGK